MCWYVGNIKISHIDNHVVSRIIGIIESEFGKVLVTRGSTHRFVGMDVTLKENKTVEVKMIDYIKECFEAFGEDIKEGANSLAKHILFEIDKKQHMSNNKMDLFHHIVAKILFVSKQARVNIDLAVSF